MKKEEKAVIESDFLSVLDNIITKGKLEKEITITKDFKLTMRVLDTWETITAESISPFNVEESSLDLVYKTRNLNKIIKAIVAINGIPIDGDELDEEIGKKRRQELYRKIGCLPASLIDKIIKGYMDLCIEQDSIFNEMDKQVENF